jgi:hypothetical protein
MLNLFCYRGFNRAAKPVPEWRAMSVGARRVFVGNEFDKSTNILPYLLKSGFKWNSDGILVRRFPEKSRICEIVFLRQNEFGKYMERKYGLVFTRRPDEAFLVVEAPDTWSGMGRRNVTIKIVEKKTQSVDGSVDLKLAAGEYLRHEYLRCIEDTAIGETPGDAVNWSVEYAFCLNYYFFDKFTSDKWKDRRFKYMQDYLASRGISIFFGENRTYNSQIMEWVLARKPWW